MVALPVAPDLPPYAQVRPSRSHLHVGVRSPCAIRLRRMHIVGRVEQRRRVGWHLMMCRLLMSSVAASMTCIVHWRAILVHVGIVCMLWHRKPRMSRLVIPLLLTVRQLRGVLCTVVGIMTHHRLLMEQMMGCGVAVGRLVIRRRHVESRRRHVGVVVVVLRRVLRSMLRRWVVADVGVVLGREWRVILHGRWLRRGHAECMSGRQLHRRVMRVGIRMSVRRVGVRIRSRGRRRRCADGLRRSGQCRT